jgi:hypothetical protein
MCGMKTNLLVYERSGWMTVLHIEHVVVHVDGVRLCLWSVVTNGSNVNSPGDIWERRTVVAWYWQGKNLSQCHPRLTYTGANPGLRGERPATNRQSHDTALHTAIQHKMAVVLRFQFYLIVKDHSMQTNFTEFPKVYHTCKVTWYRKTIVTALALQCV